MLAKKCGKCAITKPIDEFNKRTASKDGLQGRCKSCNSTTLKDHYGNNKQYYVAKSRANKKRLRQVVSEKKNKPCEDCGKSYPPYVMDFDHRDPNIKEFNVGGSCHMHGLAKTLEEIDKCDVVCANCHRIRTFGRGSSNGKTSVFGTDDGGSTPPPRAE